jgi:hypothetical protein
MPITGISRLQARQLREGMSNSPLRVSRWAAYWLPWYREAAEPEYACTLYNIAHMSGLGTLLQSLKHSQAPRLNS